MHIDSEPGKRGADLRDRHWRRVIDLTLGECCAEQPPSEPPLSVAEALNDAAELRRLRASYLRNEVRNKVNMDLEAARLIERILEMEATAAEGNAA